MSDDDFMKLAMRLALKGRKTVSPNPMVGAVIVKNGKVLGRGFHHHCGGPHAEILAIKNAKGGLYGSTLYVTLEPCAHFGRTPPCVDAIIKSGIKKVIVGMKDPNPLTNGRSIIKMRRAGITVKTGILENELRQMNEAFIKYITKKMPFVIAKTAQTLDGKIATRNGDSKWITGEKARVYSHNLRDEFDAILVGINTVLKDDPRLNASAKSINKIILDPLLRISLKAKLFKDIKPENCFIVATKTADQRKLLMLQKRGVNVIQYVGKGRHVNLKWLMKELARFKIAKILIEGGGKVIGSALRANVVDKILVFIAPKIIGDHSAVSSIDGLGIFKIKKALVLRKGTFRKIGEDYLLEVSI